MVISHEIFCRHNYLLSLSLERYVCTYDRKMVMIVSFCGWMDGGCQCPRAS